VFLTAFLHVLVYSVLRYTKGMTLLKINPRTTTNPHNPHLHLCFPRHHKHILQHPSHTNKTYLTQHTTPQPRRHNNKVRNLRLVQNNPTTKLLPTQRHNSNPNRRPSNGRTVLQHHLRNFPKTHRTHIPPPPDSQTQTREIHPVNWWYSGLGNGFDFVLPL